MVKLYKGDCLSDCMDELKHIVCFSGGHSSAIVAIEVARKFGKENVILLNHNIKGGVDGVEDRAN